ncbi:MAG: ABC transporter ATP-binding protein [Acidimicrobiia bacterium]|nr:ABC transporter ATP-binding protein [Acidimicrobiia bacterium]
MVSLPGSEVDEAVEVSEDLPALGDTPLASRDDDGDAAIVVEDLSVRFRTTRERHPTLRRKSLRGLVGRSKSSLDILALDDVSFTVRPGAVYGVIGNNGSGKTTLLRTMGGILAPTAGRVVLRGRTSLLLSMGVGMNRQLTGRENILLLGMAAGLALEEVKDHYEEIIEFSELEDAVDRPVSSYSSGMQGRLSFAVIAHLDPEIVLIDEALGAGDGRFKQKCLAKISELCEHDATVVLVSHGMGIIKRWADRCLLLDQGSVVAEGPTEQTIDTYLSRSGLQESDEAAMEDV